MKKVFKTLSAILLACACLTPGLAWADAPAVTLDASGALKAANTSGVHSILVEVSFSGDNANKVTDVTLKNPPSNALASAAYANSKATVAVSAGDTALQLTNGYLGTLDVIAQGASAETPVKVEARVTAVEYLDSADSTAETKSTAAASAGSITLTSTEGASYDPKDPDNGEDGGAGLFDNNNGNGNGNGDGDGRGTGIYGTDGGNGASGGTTTADYRANGVVSQAGQAAGNTGLVKTGDVLAICGIALGAAAVAVAVIALVSRRRGSSRN